MGCPGGRAGESQSPAPSSLLAAGLRRGRRRHELAAPLVPLPASPWLQPPLVSSGYLGRAKRERCRALSSPQPSVLGRVAEASQPWCRLLARGTLCSSSRPPVIRGTGGTGPARGSPCSVLPWARGARQRRGGNPPSACGFPRRCRKRGLAGAQQPSAGREQPSAKKLQRPHPARCRELLLPCRGALLCSPRVPLPWDLGSRQCRGDRGTHGAPGARVASPPLSCCGGSGRWGGRGGAQKGSAVTTAPDLSPAVCSGAGRAFARFPGELRVYGFPVAPFPVIGSASLIPLIDAGGRGIQPPGHPLGGFGGVAPSGGV